MTRHIGAALAVIGAIGIGIGFLAFAWTWLTEVLPFFWERGNYWPTLGTLSFVSLVAGATILGNQES